MDLKAKKKHKTSFSAKLIFSAVYQVLIFIVPLITTPYISSIFPADIMGSYSYGSSIVAYFILAASFGFSSYGITSIAKVRDDETKENQVFWELFYCIILLGSVVFAIYMIMVAANVFYSDAFPLNTKIIYAAFSVNILATVFDMTFLFQGREYFISLAMRNTAVKIISTILIFVLVKTTNDYLSYVLIICFSTFASSFVTFVSVPFLVRKPVKPVFKAMLNHYSHALIFFIPTIAITIYTVMSKLLLGVISGDSSANGYFEQADKIVNVAVTIINSLNLVMMSRMSFLYSHGMKDEIARKSDQILSLLAVLIFPAFFGLIAVNNYLTVGFLGEKYEGSVELVYLLAPLIIFVPTSGVISSIYYIPSGRLWARNMALISGAVFNLLINTILIKFFSAKGASIARALTELVVVSIYINGCRKQLSLKPLLREGPLCFDAAVVMFLAVFFTKDSIYRGISHLLANQSYRVTYILTALILVLIGCVIYFSLLILFRQKTIMRILAKINGKIKNIFRRKPSTGK